MKKKTSPTIYGTVDIGATAVKAVVIEEIGDKKRLLHAESRPLKLAKDFEKESDFNRQVSEAILELNKSLELSKCDKIFSLFYNRELQVKLIDLPSQISINQLQQILPWEAKKLLSANYKDEDFSFAYNVIKESPLSIVLAVVPQSILDVHINILKNAGLKLDSIFTDVFAAQALRPIVDVAGLPAISIVNFGYSGTHLQIFSTGKLKFYRFIPTGTSEMSNPPTEGELEIFSQKIRFSFDYFRAVSKLNQVDNIYFSGGGSQHEMLLPYAQNYFSPTKAYLLDVSSAMDISPVMSKTSIASPQTLSAYIPAIGASLAALGDNSESMDLMTQLKATANKKKMDALAKRLPMSIGLIAFIIAAAFTFYRFNVKSSELKNLEIRLSDVKSAIEATQIKIKNKTSKTNESLLNLNPVAIKTIEKVDAGKHSLHNLFAMAMRLRKPGMRISDILLRNPTEAGQITLLSQEEKFEEEAKEIPLFNSSLASALSEDEIKDDLEGNIVIIHGIAENADQLSHFSEGLNTRPRNQKGELLPQAIKRYLSISSRKTKENKIEFLLKGELR